jgi:hypothetical protein
MTEHSTRFPIALRESTADTPTRLPYYLTCTKAGPETTARKANCRKIQHPAYVDQAVKAGASWSQIAEAVGSDEAHARQRYREWAAMQHRLYVHYDGKFGMNDAAYAAAIKRASEPPNTRGAQREAGQ